MAGPIFTKAMGGILAGVDTKFNTPGGVTQRRVCLSNHGLADTNIKGKTYGEWFLSSALPSIRCSTSSSTSPSPTPSATPSTSPSQNVTVTLSANPPNTAARNTFVTFTATLSSSTAAGTITFQDSTNDQQPATRSVINGSASASFFLSTVGTHTITATFTPDDPDTNNATIVMTYIITQN